MTFFQKKTIGNKGFTLFELSLSMVIFGILMISVLLSVENMSIARIRTENRVALLQELYFFSEQLVTSIKEGGSLDYEEYWNRQSYDTTIGSGHYIKPTGVGNYGSGGDLLSNFGNGLYYCRSNNGTHMGTGGCLTGFNAINPNVATTGDFSGAYQRYGEYALQYMDYNGNADNDGGVPGDEDLDGNIVGDEDDKDIGDGPVVLSGSTPELYLINSQAKTRTYFRWIIRQDPMAYSGGVLMPCIISGTGVPNEDCLGNVQVLKLRGLDIGYDHSGNSASTGAFDGVIDSWICHPDWRCEGPNMGSYGSGATGQDGEWVDLFPDTVNVKSVGFMDFPQKDPWRAWAAPDTLSDPSAISPFIHPYVRLQLTLGFAWGKRRTIRNEDPTIAINTSVSLSNTQ